MKFKKIKNLFWLIPIFILLPSLALNISLSQKLKESQKGIKVLGVIDGDTLVLDGKTRLRLRSVDAPEVDLCGGQEAKELLEKLVKDKTVLVKEQIIDTWGRPMALVYVNDKLINEEILKTGWGRFHSDSHSAREILKSAYDNAREKSLGIFSPKCYQKTNPDNPKCNIKGNIDKNSDRINYYFPGCAQYEFTIVEKDTGESWFCTEKEAQKAGFTRSKTCP
jgi:endonuclease YncB( thermonuclease family)